LDFFFVHFILNHFGQASVVDGAAANGVVMVSVEEKAMGNGEATGNVVTEMAIVKEKEDAAGAVVAGVKVVVDGGRAVDGVVKAVALAGAAVNEEAVATTDVVCFLFNAIFTCTDTVLRSPPRIVVSCPCFGLKVCSRVAQTCMMNSLFLTHLSLSYISLIHILYPHLIYACMLCRTISC
jgi:hypothetical protein